MGYNTNIIVDVEVKEDKIEEFRKAIEEQLKQLEADGNHWFGYYADIEVEDDGRIVFEDYWRKFYEEDAFAEWLAPYVAEGHIWCYGEEPGDVWAIHFDGKGNYRIEEAAIVWEEEKEALYKIRELSKKTGKSPLELVKSLEWKA